MEHLFYTSDDDTTAKHIVDACNSEKLVWDWLTTGPSLQEAPFIQPTTEWLQFDHDDQSTIQKDINDYPRLRGWNIERAWENGDLRNAHPSLYSPDLADSVVGRRVAAMIQSWLYFGFLESILGMKVCTSYLVRYNDSGIPLLYSHNLAFAMYAWKVTTWQKDQPAQEDVLEHANETIMAILAAVQQLLLWTDSRTPPGEFTRREFPGYCELIIHIAPAINRLIDVVSTTRDQIHSDSGDRIMVFNGLRDAVEARNRRLTERGWCPFLVQSCGSNMHDSVLDWLDGSEKQSTTNCHDACTRERCIRNNIDTKTYVMRHCIDGCKCAEVKPNLGDVLAVIDNGEIPVIQVTQDQCLRLEVLSRSTQKSEFVAISHVWVDGLGSTTEIGIFECQAKRLGRLVRNISKEIALPFWIDSLCIPSDEIRRKKSIGMLRAIYKNAKKVLVLDQSIQQCPDNIRAEELLWTITSSAWMQRLWTYQESYLAKIVIFQLSNSIFILDQEFPNSMLLKPVQVVQTGLVQHLNNIRPAKDLMIPRQTNIGEVSAALNWRSTSKTGDEALAIAALFGVDSTILAATTPSERMKKFYLMVGDMPHDILFYDCPRINEMPFRWAPRSLMVRSGITIDTTLEGQSAKCTSSGLKGMYLTLTLDTVHRGEEGKVWYVKEGNDIYSISWDAWYRNTPGETFNVVVVRDIQEKRVLTPAVNNVVEGVAILHHSDYSLEIDPVICDYVGRVTLLKYDREMLPPALREHHPVVEVCNAKWQRRVLCIR